MITIPMLDREAELFLLTRMQKTYILQAIQQVTGQSPKQVLV
ncbi:hypothetical protein [Paenibacillus xylanilyticus]